MNIHPITTPASPSPASPLFDAWFYSIESLTTTFTSTVLATLETTTVTEVALGYHRNQQYSITAMTTSTGAVAERYAYTAYGQPTILNSNGSVLKSSAVGSRYTYTGREWNETLGQHHFHARWMSPLAGRFLGRDPIGYFGSDDHLYQDIDCNPLIHTAPSGMIPPIKVINAAAVMPCLVGAGISMTIDGLAQELDFIMNGAPHDPSSMLCAALPGCLLGLTHASGAGLALWGLNIWFAREVCRGCSNAFRCKKPYLC